MPPTREDLVSWFMTAVMWVAGTTVIVLTMGAALLLVIAGLFGGQLPW